MNDIRPTGGRSAVSVRWIVGGLVIIGALVIGARPGGWLDVALNASGCLGVLEEHDGSVQSVAFSPDGALLASGSQDGTARVWRVADGRRFGWTLLHTLKVSTDGREAGYSHDVAFSPDGTMLAFGLPDGSMRLWRLSGDKQHPQATLLHALQAEAERICSLAFSPDGRTLVAGAWNGSVHLWQVTGGTHLGSLKGHTAGVVSVAFSPDGTTLASASLDTTTKLWDIPSATLIHELEGPSVTTGVAFSPDGSMLVTDRQLWSADDWSFIRELEPTRGGMGNVVFSPDGTMLAAGNASYEVRWWRVADGALLHTVRGHRDSVNSVAFSPDGKALASGSLDGTVKLWRVP